MGDDTNYVKVDNSAETVSIVGVDGVYVTGIVETIGDFSQSVDSRFSSSVFSINELSASIGGGGTGIGQRVSNLEALTGSYATTGSNVFIGTQTIVPTEGSGENYVGIIVSGSNTNGGSGYVDFLKVTNTADGATNINKTFRENSDGTIEIVNSVYDTTIFSLTDGGDLAVIGEISGSTINGIGNVTSYSSSVDSRLHTLETTIDGGSF